MPSVIPSQLLVPFLIPLNSFESLSVAEARVPQPVSRLPLALEHPHEQATTFTCQCQRLLHRLSPRPPAARQEIRVVFTLRSLPPPLCLCLPSRRTPHSHIPQPLRVTCSLHCDRHTAQVFLFGSPHLASLQLSHTQNQTRAYLSIDSSHSLTRLAATDSVARSHQPRTVHSSPRPVPAPRTLGICSPLALSRNETTSAVSSLSTINPFLFEPLPTIPSSSCNKVHNNG